MLPEEEYARRIRKATKKNASKTKSKTLSKEYIFSKLILIVSGWRISWQVANWLYKKE